MKWKKDILRKLTEKGTEPFVCYKNDNILFRPAIHLAVFNEPYLSLLLSGEKTIESRFSKNNIAPHFRVKEGDIILLKKSGGKIEGYMKVKKVLHSGPVNSQKLTFFEKNFSPQICASVDANFWDARNQCNYATLVQIHEVEKLVPFSIEKKDRRGWVIL